MQSSDPSLLIGWRGSEPAPPEPFAEAYFCVTCGDYFSLALVPRSQPQAPGVFVVATPDGPLTSVEVRCPQCSTAYPLYGAIGGAAAVKRSLEAHELLRIGFPPDAAPAHKVIVGELRVERFVLLVAGPLPPLHMLTEFAVSAVDTMIRKVMRTTVTGGRVPLHLLTVEGLSDEAPWLAALLDTHVYHGTFGARTFASVGPIEADSGTQALLCAVSPADAADAQQPSYT